MEMFMVLCAVTVSRVQINGKFIKLYPITRTIHFIPIILRKLLKVKSTRKSKNNTCDMITFKLKKKNETNPTCAEYMGIDFSIVL